MCQFCFNSDNGKRKFRLFDINPIPLIAPFKSRRCFDTLLESEKSSDVLLKSKMSPNTALELKRSSSYHSVVNSSINNFAGVTNEIRELLYAYQLLHLRTVLFLEGIHIKGIIINVSQNLVTVSGPNVEVTSNSTGNIIGYPNRINVKLESIQAIGDVE
ncbi:hypothetical protein [Bacillus thuringiensis]|uniref:Uncharacterized protein n=1 Tax=Bacillus thuringiensis serovar toumanoffi TaxID=180862 RepID=A0ABD5HRN4_BACTU|nr:hypothetical protein [Bacillus thuringiensis]MCR6783812.1 hypothetical protein [Bacillus thuringiensis]MCR6861914.1 hypothetical protein [Bacillus thuringiensis]MCR6868778.1 hypothetical protein [Bacillus thuringiensis]MDW9207588.1 hypothetical protein [Bacillus thuringiensis serovar toumanoffi]MED2623696.1 hypothetical protein [Bacillus thuringiensis]